MTKDDLTRLDACVLLDMPGKHCPDRSLVEAHVAEGIPVDGGLSLETIDFHSLRDDDEDVGIADGAAVFHRADGLLTRGRGLPDEGEVRAPRHPPLCGHPA